MLKCEDHGVALICRIHGGIFKTWRICVSEDGPLAFVVGTMTRKSSGRDHDWMGIFVKATGYEF
jgi:hypothetical protein